MTDTGRIEFDADRFMNPRFLGIDRKMSKATQDVNNSFEAQCAALWNENCNANIEKRIMPVTELWDMHTGREAVVVGAGETFYRNIHLVRELQESGMIVIALDRTLPFFKRKGLNPDYVVSIDHRPDVMKFLQYAETGDKVVCCLYQHQPMIDMLVDRHVETWGYMQFIPLSRFWQKKFRKSDYKPYYGLMVNSIVSTAGYDLAYWLGCKSVYALGCDLSWDRFDDITMDYRRSTPVFHMEQSNGRKAFSTTIFMGQSQDASLYPRLRPGCEWIDISKGMLNGWKHGQFSMTMLERKVRQMKELEKSMKIMSDVRNNGFAMKA